MSSESIRGYVKIAVDRLNGTDEELTREQKRKLLRALYHIIDVTSESQAEEYNDKQHY